MDTQIRKAMTSDIEALSALSCRTIRASYWSFLGETVVEAFLASGAADQYVRETLAQCSVIVAEGKLVGYTVCKDDLIDLMMIDPEYQGCGLGTRLLEHCQEMLFQNFEALTLESFEQNQKANNFYWKHGWSEVKRYFDQSSGVYKLVFCKTVSLPRCR
jgi:ribosomal protein S18 acetylase RimI-like enzyme